MAKAANTALRASWPFGWLDQLQTLLARELAPGSRKFRTTLRMTTIATIGVGLVAICHVNNELGAYIVWLLVGAGPMMSARKAGAVVVAEALALAASVVMARALAETPWLMLPFLFAVISFTTYAGTARKLGTALLLIQVVCLDTFYAVVFAPQAIGWGAAGAFGGSAIAFGVILLFDNWLWPAPSEANLMESLGASVGHARTRLLHAAEHYLDSAAPTPPLPPPTSDLPAHMALLDQAAAEGVSAHRDAILLAAVTRVARINLEVDRLILAVRENAPREIRAMVRPEIEAAVEAVAAALDEIARELPTYIRIGPDQPPPASRTRARAAMDALAARVLEVRPRYIGSASPGEIENFASFNDALAALTSHIERLLDEPPRPRATGVSHDAVVQPIDAPDPALVRYALKVGMCAVIGYVIGIVSQRVEMSTILTTVLITALPSYGASLRKMILRIVGAVIGGAISLLAIIMVTPNFDTLPAYLIAIFVVFYLSGYCSLASGRVAYAGKQIGTTYALVFAGLSPSVDIYGPLWRIWGILTGTFVVAILTLILWPVYAGDSLPPRLRKVIRDTLALAPGGSAANSEDEIQRANSETMRVLAEILQVADDAQMEGRASMVDHNAIVEAAGTLRRIANRLASIAAGRIVTPTPQLDPVTELARETALNLIRRDLQSWLAFIDGPDYLSAAAAAAIAQAHRADDLKVSLNQFILRLEEREFARMASWTLEQRRTMLAEIQSMRRLELLIGELNRWLAQIPGPAPQTASPVPVPRGASV